MEILTRASLLHVLLLFMVNFSQNNFVQSAVGLYGPDRYEGKQSQTNNVANLKVFFFFLMSDVFYIL